MAIEIERKFLVKDDWRPEGQPICLRQGYLPLSGPMLVRIRQQDDRAFLTLKGRVDGVTRSEYEYEIPTQDAEELLMRCRKPLIEKMRYLVPVGSYTWEVDVFSGANSGLVVAEIELSSEDEAFDRPDWIVKEVSGDIRYYNSNLAVHPFSEWER